LCVLYYFIDLIFILYVYYLSCLFIIIIYLSYRISYIISIINTVYIVIMCCLLFQIHVDSDPKIIIIEVAQCLALRLRERFSGNGKFIDPGSLGIKWMLPAVLL